MDRRKFLKTTAGGALVTIAVGPTSGCGNDVEPAPLARATVLTSLSQNVGPEATLNDVIGSVGYGSISLVVPFYKDLNRPGGAITIFLPVDATDQNRAYTIPPDNTVLVIQRPDGTFGAFQSSCPHAACPLGYTGKDIECPCHSSRFAANTANGKCAGDLLHPPSMAPILAWKTTVAMDATGRQHLTIDLASPLSCNNDFPALVGTMLTLPFADFPQLMMPGGAAAGLPQGATDPIVIIRLDASTVSALGAKCTHRGCTVAFNAMRKDLECPCHGSVFAAADGHVLSPPATAPLKKYQATLMSDGIVVNVV